MKPLKPSFKSLLRKIPVKKMSVFKPDAVCGIARNGLVPAAMVSASLGVPLLAVKASLYNDERPARKIRGKPKISLGKLDVNGRRVILVDDVSNTGATLRAVKSALMKKGAKQVKTFVLFGKSDFSKTKFVKCVRFPWQK